MRADDDDDDAGLDGPEGVKDGLRSAEENAAGRGLVPLALLPVAPDPLPSADSDLPALANQLFVAAIACRTAWRPLSSTPFPDEAESPDGSLPAAPFSATAPFSAAAASVLAGLAPGPLDLPIPSAGNGTGA